MQEYSIPKQRFTAVVVLEGGSPMTMTFFHSRNAPAHTGHERPSDVLNGRSAFLPAHDDGGRLLLVNVDAIRMASVSVDEEWANPLADPPSGEDYTRDLTATIAKVEVALDDGSRLTGLVRYELPESGRRLQDYLNAGDRFMVLIDGETIRFINRRCVNSIAALDEMKGGC